MGNFITARKGPPYISSEPLGNLVNSRRRLIYPVAYGAVLLILGGDLHIQWPLGNPISFGKGPTYLFRKPLGIFVSARCGSICLVSHWSILQILGDDLGLQLSGPNPLGSRSGFTCLLEEGLLICQKNCYYFYTVNALLEESSSIDNLIKFLTNL